MAITIELTANLAMNILRDDIVENLGYEGIEAVIDFYNECYGDEPIECDQSLFWVWHKYDNAVAAYIDHYGDVSALKEEDEEVDLEKAALEELNNETTALLLSDGSVVVMTEF